MYLQNMFLTVWNMSLTSSIIIGFVLLVRLFLRNSPKVFSYVLWSVVLFRLLCPVSISSMFSVLNFTKAAEVSPQSIVTTMDYSSVEIPEFIPVMENKPDIEEPIIFESDYNESLVEDAAPQNNMGLMELTNVAGLQTSAEPTHDIFYYAALIWLTGLGVMLIYNLVSCIRLFKQIDSAVPLRKELYLVDDIPTAFVLGVIKPKIYLPSYLNPEEQGYIIAHERCHIKRKDHIFRLLAYLALCLHWFNPLVWLAFILSGKDMEMSCDEAVIQMYGSRIRADYAQSLLSLSTGTRNFVLTPLAFGEGDTKERVVNMSKWKKPENWIVITALLICVAVLAACALNPANKADPYWDKSKDTQQVCMEAVNALLDTESYCILYEKDSEYDAEYIEYRKSGSDQLVLCREEKTNSRIYKDGRLGQYRADPLLDMYGWAWQRIQSEYDPDAWLREWSPEYMEVESVDADERSITLAVQWPHNYNPDRYYKGSITYTFNIDGSLETACREASLIESKEPIISYIDRITVLPSTPEENDAAILAVADQCVEWLDLTPESSSSKALPVRNSVAVQTVDEFLAAIAPDTTITLQSGRYNLTTASNYGGDTGSDYYYWRDVGDGYELVIKNLSNFEIQGAGMHATTIETDPRYANVIKMEDCANVWLNGFTAGHTRGNGGCGGNVIELVECSSYEMSNLGLFGCGVVGLYAKMCGNITLRNSDIYECSSSAIQMELTNQLSIIDCDFYKIGTNTGSAYTVFFLTDCPAVQIEGCTVKDNISSYLLASPRSHVTIRNCLIQENRFEHCALDIRSGDVILSSNQFRDNSIRKWYYYPSATAIDENGSSLTENMLDEMYGTIDTTPPQKQTEVHVSTADEFLAAIGPNKEIILDAETFNLSTAQGYGSSSSDYYFWQDTYVDGYELVIRNVNNMTIRGSKGKDHHTIEAVPRYANVLLFRACSNITVSGITAGHTKEPGSCTGGVLRFEDSDYIMVENSGLFGCGTKGIDGHDCGDFTVKNCDIYECSEGGMEFRNTSLIRLEQNTFRDIGGRNYMLVLDCTDVIMDGKVLVSPDMIGSIVLANEVQAERNALEDSVRNFAYYYFWDRQEEMQEYLSTSYSGTGETHNTGKTENKSMYFEVTSEHVQEVEKSGSTTIEVPYRPYRIDEGEKFNIIRYLLVTVVKENGTYKISNYQLKE